MISFISGFLLSNYLNITLKKLPYSGKIFPNSTYIVSKNKNNKLKKEKLIGIWEPYKVHREEKINKSDYYTLMNRNLVIRNDIIVSPSGENCTDYEINYEIKEDPFHWYYQYGGGTDLGDFPVVEQSDTFHNIVFACPDKKVGNFEFIQRKKRDIIMANVKGAYFFYRKK